MTGRGSELPKRPQCGYEWEMINSRDVKTWIALSSVGFLALLLTLGMLLRADSTPAERDSDSGVTHIHDSVSKVPWSVHIVKIDRSRKDLALVAPLARDKILGISRISDHARSLSPQIGRALAGVNGDFYERDNPTYAGDPRGLQIVNGELVSAPSNSCVWFDPKGNPHVDEVKGDFKVTWPDGSKTAFGLNQQRRSNTAVLYTPTYGPSTRVTGGRDFILEKAGTAPWLPLQANQTYRARIREVKESANSQIPDGTMLLSVGPQLANSTEAAAGAILEFSTTLTPDLSGARTAIGGNPILIKDGKAFSLKAPPPGVRGGYSEGSKYERHPRSAIGWNSTHIYLITVDGRQPGLSIGMTIADLAEYLVKLGCTDGMNCDGGASACLWMSGKIINNPCQGERPVANSLFVVQKAEETAQQSPAAGK
jgi:hypothetical protein